MGFRLQREVTSKQVPDGTKDRGTGSRLTKVDLLLVAVYLGLMVIMILIVKYRSQITRAFAASDYVHLQVGNPCPQIALLSRSAVFRVPDSLQGWTLLFFFRPGNEDSVNELRTLNDLQHDLQGRLRICAVVLGGQDLPDPMAASAEYISLTAPDLEPLADTHEDAYRRLADSTPEWLDPQKAQRREPRDPPLTVLLTHSGEVAFAQHGPVFATLVDAGPTLLRSLFSDGPTVREVSGAQAGSVSGMPDGPHGAVRRMDTGESVDFGEICGQGFVIATFLDAGRKASAILVMGPDSVARFRLLHRYGSAGSSNYRLVFVWMSHERPKTDRLLLGQIEGPSVLHLYDPSPELLRALNPAAPFLTPEQIAPRSYVLLNGKKLLYETPEGIAPENPWLAALLCEAAFRDAAKNPNSAGTH